MSISETFRYDGNVQVDTSNFRKHTSDNPIQRRLIDRFHQRITGIVTGYAPSTLLDAGCGEGFVADIFQTAMPAAQITGFDVLEDSVALASLRNPRGTFAVGDIYNIDFPDNVVRCRLLLRSARTPARAGPRPEGNGPRGVEGGRPQRSPRAILLPGKCRSWQEPRPDAEGLRSGPSQFLVASSVRRLRLDRAQPRTGHRIDAMDDPRRLAKGPVTGPRSCQRGTLGTSGEERA